MKGLCECGCGQATKISSQSNKSRGLVKGEPRRFVHGHNALRDHGSYRHLYRPDHPKATPDGSVREHVFIAETVLGRLLPPGAQVHHVDHNRRNNAHSNLVVCESDAYHKLLHQRERVVKRGGNPNTQRLCWSCKELRLIAEMAHSKGVLACICKRCKADGQAARYYRKRQKLGFMPRRFAVPRTFARGL